MSPCHGCHAGCCRAFAVPLTGADVLRIERRLGLNFWEFACRWEDPEDAISQGVVPHFYFDDAPGVPFVLSLMHVDSASFPGTTKCRFLSEQAPTAERPLGTGQCSIHGEHPMACRVFPTKLSESGQLAVIYDVPEHSQRIPHHAAYQLCPRPWETDDVDPVDSMANLVVMNFELKFFHQVATAWNRSPQAWAVFPEFLRMVYENRVIKDPNAQDVPLEETWPATLPFVRPVVPVRKVA
ncbi:MAG TPA: YkgJ family cysteine cluster protein [Planctomycetaceae bacterium]|nr:YkgJ family cysteine cluster protein [Planctomycetaceae bacterium]